MNKPLLLLSTLAVALVLAGCTDEENPLLDYEGERPLTLQEVTMSAQPDIQWVGGRVAAVGVNRGSKAALDSTLVWIMTADGDEIDSHVTIGEGTDVATIERFGGVPLDSLEDNTQYTFWLAEKSVFDAGLATGQLDSVSFADTTFGLRYRIRGITAGDESFISGIQLVRDQKLLTDSYRLTWTPSTTPVRHIAIRQARSGGFTDLVWYVVLPDGVPDSIYPPVVIGQTPPGANEATPWSGTGFESGTTYTLWMASGAWNGDFSPNASEYASFQFRFE